VQRTIGLAELLEGCRAGAITEVFAAGTAAVISPVLGLRGDEFDVTVGDGRPGPTTVAIREQLLATDHVTSVTGACHVIVARPHGRKPVAVPAPTGAARLVPHEASTTAIGSIGDPVSVRAAGS